MKYIDFNKIRQIPCLHVLHGECVATKKLGGSVFFSAPDREEDNPSVSVDLKRNHWTDFGTGESGSVIDLVVKLGICDDVRAAAEYLDVNYLNGQASADYHVHVAKQHSSRSKSVVMPDIKVEPVDAYWTKYLEGRGIPVHVASSLLSKVTYSYPGGKPVSGVGHRNRAGGYVVRFNFPNQEQNKKNIGPADITRIAGKAPSGICRVYEGQMDYLSHIVLDPTVTSEDAVILNSTKNLGKATDVLSSYRDIRCFLDHDETGQEALQQLVRSFPQASDDSLFYFGCKDINIYLTQRPDGEGHSV